MANSQPLLPEPGSIHYGTISGIQEFGAFVRLDGFRYDGLVHISELAMHVATVRKASRVKESRQMRCRGTPCQPTWF